jgi:hypothetical protein
MSSRNWPRNAFQKPEFDVRVSLIESKQAGTEFPRTDLSAGVTIHLAECPAFPTIRTSSGETLHFDKFHVRFHNGHYTHSHSLTELLLLHSFYHMKH